MNFASIISSIHVAITASFKWFLDMCNATGAYYYVLGGIITMLIFRFLVFPLVAGRRVTFGDHSRKADQNE